MLKLLPMLNFPWPARQSTANTAKHKWWTSITTTWTVIRDMVLLCACVPAACPHMIATQCASFVGALASVHKLSWLDSVNFGPHELWVITVTNSKHIVNNLNGYEGINLIQSSRPKLQLPDLVCTLCQNSHLWEELYADVFLPVLAMYLVSGAGRAAQLPTCLFGILLAKFGSWA